MLAEAHPAISVPMMPTPMTASTSTTLASTSAPTTRGDSGMTASATRYGMSATNGASRKAQRSARAGVMSSFWTNFTPSATSCAHPWKPPAYIGPSRPCMWAMTLCSVWPTSSGSTRKAASTATARSDDLEPRRHVEAHRGPHSGPGTPGAWTRRRPGACAGVVALAGLLGARPRPWRPGRRARTTCAAASPRSRRAAAAGAARGRCRRRSRRSRCRTSRGSRARARRRPGRRRSATAPAAPRARACAAAPTAALPGARVSSRWHTTSKPASSPSRSVSSTAVSQSKYV